ncbi:transcription initiation factor TFIID subunit 10-like [Histomonas meleagridis]|uniref:transcription initiation factor TFIID subunit 10-like n=1 Tax=Histomonas meleagridis TaxID=135588 RepID=UPI00355AB4D2|nr:transcription initiation factor TFIID subunit 10-like [Histomonas meleagridis]KAH0800847.1 transcription initiation factor TFIID subunit 10-like [Histomonas meleagridis]
MNQPPGPRPIGPPQPIPSPRLIQINQPQEILEENEYISKLVESLNEHQTSFPNAVTTNIAAQSGMYTSDKNVVKVITVMTEKFILDVLNECKKESPDIQLYTVKKALGKKDIRCDRPDYIVQNQEASDCAFNQNSFSGLFDFIDREGTGNG